MYVKSLNQLAGAYSTQRAYDPDFENQNLKAADHHKKLIDMNLDVLKAREEKDRLVQKMAEMKTRFNDMVKSKADL